MADRTDAQKCGENPESWARLSREVDTATGVPNQLDGCWMTEHFERGPCRECGLTMISQREWNRNPAIRRPGYVKASSFGRCQACYMRGYRNGAFPTVTIASSFPVDCDRCGLVGSPTSRGEANRLRVEHLESHDAAPLQRSAPKLPDAELARLRQLVGATAGTPNQGGDR